MHVEADVIVFCVGIEIAKIEVEEVRRLYATDDGHCRLLYPLVDNSQRQRGGDNDAAGEDEEMPE